MEPVRPGPDDSLPSGVFYVRGKLPKSFEQGAFSMFFPMIEAAICCWIGFGYLALATCLVVRALNSAS